MHLMAVPRLPPLRSFEEDPGVVDHRVESLHLQGFRDARKRAEVGEVQAHRPHPRTGNPRPDRPHGGLGTLGAPAAQHDRGAGNGQRLGGEVPDTCIAAGDQIHAASGRGHLRHGENSCEVRRRLRRSSPASTVPPASDRSPTNIRQGWYCNGVRRD